MSIWLVKAFVRVGLYSMLVPVLVQAAAEQVDYNRRLLYAADNGDVGTVRSALRMMADVNVVNNKGRTPLMMATERGHECVVAVLIQKKANVNAESDVKETPLWLAIANDKTNIAETLVDGGANINNAREYTENGKELVRQDALLHATGRGNEHIVRMLLDKNADVNKQDEFNSCETALMIAVERADKDIVKELLVAGADEKIKDIAGRTVHDYINDMRAGPQKTMKEWIESTKICMSDIRANRQPRGRQPAVEGKISGRAFEDEEYTPRIKRGGANQPSAYGHVAGNQEQKVSAFYQKEDSAAVAQDVRALARAAQEFKRVLAEKVEKLSSVRQSNYTECLFCTYHNELAAHVCEICGVKVINNN